MPVPIPCPQCGAKLNVPGTALGKRVKCSKCATTFLAETTVDEPEGAGVQAAAPPRPARDRRPTRSPEDDEDDEDDERLGRREHDDGGVSTLIPYKNGRALAAYYCGVFAIIPCAGLILGPIAFIFGILGLRFARANPTAKGTGHAIAGIVLGSIAILGNWGFVLLMVIVAIVEAAKGKH